MEKSRRNLLIYGAIALGVVIIIISVGVIVFRGNDDLPPVDQEQSTQGVDPTLPDTAADEGTILKDGVTFVGFGELERYDITDTRIDVILYVMATYANEHLEEGFRDFTYNKASLKETREGEMNITTFNATDTNGEVYKVELSYVYSADAFVRLFNKDGAVVQTSPYE